MKTSIKPIRVPTNKRSSNAINVMKTLRNLAQEEVTSKPAFKVTYIGNVKPKIVRRKSSSELSTESESE